MKKHLWDPTTFHFEIGANGDMTEGWGRCRQCLTDAYITISNGVITGFHVGGSRSGTMVDVDCSNILIDAVMTA